MANNFPSSVNPTITIIDSYSSDTPAYPTQPKPVKPKPSEFEVQVKKMASSIFSLKAAKQINSWIGSYTEDTTRQNQVALALNVAGIVGTAAVTGNPMALMALPVMAANSLINYEIKTMKIENGASYVSSLTGGTWNGGR